MENISPEEAIKGIDENLKNQKQYTNINKFYKYTKKNSELVKV